MSAGKSNAKQGDPKMDLFAVLTASKGVPDEVVAQVAMSLGGRPHRLDPFAVEIKFDGEPLSFALDGIDINFVPAQNRAKRLLIADMDSTIITVECIDELADFAGKKAEVSEITERAMRGELDFEQALRERVAMLKGVTRDDIKTCFETRVSLTPGAIELVTAMNTRGTTALVSGGFTVFTDKVVAQTGFEHATANTLLFDGEALSGEVGVPIVHSETKLDVLTRLLGEQGLGYQDAIAVGDGANDAPMIEAAGLGVAFCAKPALREIADAVLDHSDLTALLALQGIKRPFPILDGV